MSNSNENQTNPDSEQIIQETTTENNPSFKKPKNFKKFSFIAGGILITFIAIFLVIKYCLPTIDNSASLSSLGPKEYYNKIEQNQLKELAASAKKSYENYLKSLDFFCGGKVGQKADIKISVDPSFSKTYLSLDKLEPIELKMLAMVNSQQAIKMDYEVLYNDKSLLTLNAIIDILNANAYFKIPELNKAFLSTKLESTPSSSSKDDTSTNEDNTFSVPNNFVKDPTSVFALETYLSSDDFYNLIIKYGDIIINNTSNIILDKEQTITVNGLSTVCSKLTVSYSSSEYNKLIEKICNEIKQDKILHSYFVDWIGITEDEYTDLVNKIQQSEIAASKNNTYNDFLTLYIWTDEAGNVIGREFHQKSSQNSDEDTTFRYQKSKKDKEGALEFHISQDDVSISLVITTTENDGFLSGTANLQYKETSKSNNSNIFCDFKNYKIIDAEKELFTGTFTLSTPLLPGFQFIIDAKENQGAQNLTFDVLMGNQKTITVSLTDSFTDYEDFSNTPEGTIYDIDNKSQTNEYLKDIDSIGFIAKIKDALGDQLFNLLFDDDETTNDTTAKEDIDALLK